MCVHITCTHINGQKFFTSVFVSDDGTVAMFFLLCMREVEKPSEYWTLVADGTCDMDHLPPNTFMEAENRRCALAI